MKLKEALVTIFLVITSLTPGLAATNDLILESLAKQHSLILRDLGAKEGKEAAFSMLEQRVKDHLRSSLKFAQTLQPPADKYLSSQIVREIYLAILESKLRFDYSDQVTEIKALLSPWPPKNRDDLLSINEEIMLLLKLYVEGATPITAAEIDQGVRKKIEVCGSESVCRMGDFLYYSWRTSHARSDGRWDESRQHVKAAGEALLASGALPALIDKEFLAYWRLTGEFQILMARSKVAEALNVARMLQERADSIFYDRALDEKDPTRAISLVMFAWNYEEKVMLELMGIGQDDEVKERANKILTRVVLPTLKRDPENSGLVIVRKKLVGLITR